ncbi:hypothetical protein BV22DRAFT_1134240 [Leucogyrophana mollusca]|uniref:Uncharacterized protein n=1 Tax=Leucogyrophana mollusca TaxID=85980 RepID=A0ACB8B1A5_9AGAM|nr:hypothetical protein BV22DRAFT_1134240 [Leucogyrophana mollusca]
MASQGDGGFILYESRRPPPTSSPLNSKPKLYLSKQCNGHTHVEPAKEAQSAHLILKPTFRVGAVPPGALA